MYKQASRLKLRFQTNVGLLSVEQLWDLTQTQLANAIKAVKKVLKKNDDDELSFLEYTKEYKSSSFAVKINKWCDVFAPKVLIVRHGIMCGV